MPTNVAAESKLIGKGSIGGTPAKDFQLSDHRGGRFHLFSALERGPVLLAFYPGDFTFVCTKQLCNYRDHWQGFQSLGVQIVGLSANSTMQHKAFADKYQFPFPLLTDSSREVAFAYGCRSLLMFNGFSRAVVIIGRQKIVLYRYIEPTILSRRKADELITVLRDLKEHNLL